LKAIFKLGLEFKVDRNAVLKISFPKVFNKITFAHLSGSPDYQGIPLFLFYPEKELFYDVSVHYCNS
jgi:hypothetical protein